MCPGQACSSRHKVVIVSLLLQVAPDRAMLYSNSLYKSSTYFGKFASRENSVGWVGRWLEMMKYRLTADFSVCWIHRPGLSHFRLLTKTPGFLPGVRGLLLFDNGQKQQWEKKCQPF